MALKLWLPLNGNATNYGLTDIAMSGSPASWQNGPIGKCASFNNNTGNVISNSTTAFNFTTQNFSWSVWINKIWASHTTSAMYAFTVGRADAGGYGYGLEIASTTEVRLRFGSWSNTISGVPDNEWHHIAFVRNGDTLKIYRDGACVATASRSGSLPTYSDGGGPGLGCFHYTGNIYPLIGHLSDFRIYDHALSTKTVRELSHGLALHIPFYGDGYPGIGENIAIGSWRNMATRSIGQYYDRLLYDAGFFGLSAGEQYTYTVKLTAPSDRSVAARVQYYTSDGDRLNIVGNYVPAGTTGYSHITETLTSEQRGKSRMELNIQNGNTSLTSSATYYVGEVKLERGDHSTAWSPHSANAEYGSDYGIVKETTGYGTVSVNGSPKAISSGPRYGMSAHFAGGNTTEAGDYVEYTAPVGLTKATWMVWINIDDTQGSYPSLDAKKGNPTGDLWLTVNTESNAVWAYYSGIYNKSRTILFSPGDWHHVAFVWDTGITQWYVDGEVQGTAVDMSSKSTTWPSSVHTLGTSYTGSSWSGAKLKSRLCDWRFYSTALSADDIMGIVRAPVSFTDNGEVHCGTLAERDGQVSVEKSSIVKCSSVTEIYGRFDNKTRIEPDGSAWVRIVHHADPGAGNLFASSDSFGTWVYKDAKRWFHGKMCDYADRWEFMIEQKANSSASTLKFRWVQTINPNTAAYADVAAASITKNTSTGYTSFSHGGLYKRNSSAYYTTNNGTQSNWWGAVGAWSNTTNGIPAWNGTEVGSGGFEDLYIRVDGGANWSFPDNDRVSIVKTDNSLTGYGIVEI